MENQLFGNKKQILARAIYVGDRIDVKALESTHRIAVLPTVVSVGETGCAVLFRYGAIVLFDVKPIEETSFLNNLKLLIQDPVAKPALEEAKITQDDSKDEHVDTSSDSIILRHFSIERLQVFANVLAKCVVLSHFESYIEYTFDQIEPLAEATKHNRIRYSKNRDLLNHIGSSLLIQHKMVGRAEVIEKPDVLWDHPELERFYLRLVDEYELPEREVALERKLKLISETVERLLDLMQTSRSMRLELYIVILIVFEICLTIFENWIEPILLSG